MKIDDILTKTNQHLRGGLAADTTINVWFCLEELGRLTNPAVGNRVSHENNPLGIGRLFFQILIRLVIPAELIPILELIRKTLRGIDQAAIRPRRIKLVQ